MISITLRLIIKLLWVVGLFFLLYSAVRAEHLSYNDVLPILQENCLSCHRHPGAPNGLSMETFDLLVQGGKHGQVVRSGDSDNSEMVKRLKGLSRPRMPFNGPYLSESEISKISRWIDAGMLKAD